MKKSNLRTEATTVVDVRFYQVIKVQHSMGGVIYRKVMTEDWGRMHSLINNLKCMYKGCKMVKIAWHIFGLFE